MAKFREIAGFVAACLVIVVAFAAWYVMRVDNDDISLKSAISGVTR